LTNHIAGKRRALPVTRPKRYSIDVLIHRKIIRTVLGVILATVATGARGAELITVATYNIENLKELFLARRLAADKENPLPKIPQVADLMREMRNANDEDLWEVSEVILHPNFNPDVLVIQEGCSQEDLEDLNKRWLKSAYETVLSFPGNSERGQMLGLLAKPGFKVLQRKDQYHLEPDSVKNERGDRLFARGPAFALIESPSGYRFWVGVTHQKSKSGNSAEVTAWRNREAKRTHEIMRELEQQGPSDVMLLGDMNDELGIQEFEMEVGADVIKSLLGPAEHGFVLATKPLIDAGRISYGGYWRGDFRSFIDQIVITKSMADQVKDVNVFTEGFARVASDHYPVYVRIEADSSSPTSRP
jgi:endonuclease/exonuclease/phosphatase family metal-dependent hydrolase